jgi:hypothetical protein
VNLAEVRDGLSTQLQTVSGVRVYDAVPETIEPPCAVIALADGVYHEDFDGAVTANWTVLLFVSRVDDVRAQDALDLYLSSTGDESIKAAVETDSDLTASVDTCQVTGWDPPQTYTIAETSYVGVEINVETLG